MKTVKVRIAVTVDLHGDWNAAGWGRTGNSDDMMDMAMEHISEGEAQYWVIAELEIPEEEKVKEVKASEIKKVE